MKSMKTKQKKKLVYGVIGLGRFGFALAKELAAHDCELVVIDKDEDTVNAAAAFADNAHIIQGLTKESLEQAGIQNCDVVIVGIAEKIDVCILTTLHVKRLGVKRIIVKAMTAEQGDILEMMGAEVVFPERDMAVRLANRLTAPNLLDYIALSDDVNITEIEMPAGIAGHSIISLDVRKNYNLNVMAIKRGQQVEIDFSPHFVLQGGDILVVIGRKENIHRFEEKLQAY
ncbi:MAG: TrkA family potassium uptake protein [Ruminococcus sp.]|nr:TrkA family potassium uptake protein [Ruminococcus sp.]